MAGIQIDGVNNKIDFDDDLDTSISANTDDTLVIEAGGNTMATITATTFTINDGTTITVADNTDNLTLTSTDADGSLGPNLRMYRNSSSPADGDDLGRLDFEGRNDNSQDVVFGRIRSQIRDASDGTEDGKMDFGAILAGTEIDWLTFDALDTGGASVIFNQGSVDIDFRVESNGNTHMLFVDGGNNAVGIGNTGTLDGILHIKGAGDTYVVLEAGATDGNTAFFFHNSGGTRKGFITYDTDDNFLSIGTDDTERMKINNNGATQIHSSINDVLFFVQNTATSGNVYGQQIQFSSTVNDTGNYFFRCLGNNNSTVRAAIYSNGDFDSATNSYGATSDERIKQNITDANSQWNDIKGLKVRNFKFKDEVRTEAGGGQAAKTYLGLVAQEAETVSPGLIKEKNPEKADILSSSEFGTLYEDGDDIPEGKAIGDVKEVTEQVKSVSYSVLYMKAIKALQEAQTRIETLETKVAALEG